MTKKEKIELLDEQAVKALELGWESSLNKNAMVVELTKGDKVITISKSTGIYDGSNKWYEEMRSIIINNINKTLKHALNLHEFHWRHFKFKYIRMKNSHKITFVNEITCKNWYAKENDLNDLIRTLLVSVVTHEERYFNSMRFVEEDFKVLKKIPNDILQVLHD